MKWKCPSVYNLKYIDWKREKESKFHGYYDGPISYTSMELYFILKISTDSEDCVRKYSSTHWVKSQDDVRKPRSGRKKRVTKKYFQKLVFSEVLISFLSFFKNKLNHGLLWIMRGMLKKIWW